MARGEGGVGGGSHCDLVTGSDVSDDAALASVARAASKGDSFRREREPRLCCWSIGGRMHSDIALIAVIALPAAGGTVVTHKVVPIEVKVTTLNKKNSVGFR